MHLFAQFLWGGIFTSCNKDEISTIKKESSENISDKELELQILDFSALMKSSRKAATNETMNFADALWMLEASFNYNNCFSEGDCEFTQTDSVYIPVNYGSFDEIPMAELQNLFISINNKLGEIYNVFNASNKGVVFIDFELEATPNGNQIFINMAMGSFSTQKQGATANKINPFGPTDYWFPGNLYHDVEHRKGKCRYELGQYAGVADAESEIERAIMKYNCSKNSPLYYYVSISPLNASNPNTNLFRGFSNSCINPYGMNLFYNEVVKKIALTRAHNIICLGKDLVGVTLDADGTFNNDGTTNYDGTPRYYSIMYVSNFYFGTRKIRKVTYFDKKPFSL